MKFDFQLVYSHLYKAESVREVGTLKFFRERLNRRNVTPEKVTKSYEGCEQFIISVGTAYLLEAALEYWGMDSLKDVPTKHIPPKGILHMSLEKKKEYFNNVIGGFVDEYVMADPDSESLRHFQESEKQETVVNNIEAEHDYAAKEPKETMDIEVEVDEEKQQTNAVDKVRYTLVPEVRFSIQTL